MEKTVSKKDFVQIVQEKGIAARKAKKAVNAVFQVMADGLRRGELVEIPGGVLRTVVKNLKRRSSSRMIHNVNKNRKEYRIIEYPGGRRRVIQFLRDRSIDLEPPVPAPPPPPPPTEEELRIAERLKLVLDCDYDAAQVLPAIRQAFEPISGYRQSSLAGNLRHFHDRGFRFPSVEALAHALRVQSL